MENISIDISLTVSKFNFAVVPQIIDYWKNKKGIKKIIVNTANEPWNTPFLVGKESFEKIAKSSPYTEDWKYEEPQLGERAYELHEMHKKFWNSRRGMDWDSIDVSRY